MIEHMLIRHGSLIKLGSYKRYDKSGASPRIVGAAVKDLIWRNPNRPLIVNIVIMFALKLMTGVGLCYFSNTM